MAAVNAAELAMKAAPVAVASPSLSPGRWHLATACRAQQQRPTPGWVLV